MVRLPFGSRCHICGATEGLRECIICGKKTCQLHMVDGKCHKCLEREALGTKTAPVARKEEKTKGSERDESADLNTQIKIGTRARQALAELYLLAGGRPGTKRSTTPMGSMKLDQDKKELMIDRQVARRIYSTTTVRSPSDRQLTVDTRSSAAIPIWRTKSRERGQDEAYATVRTAHDMVLRSLDLISRSVSEGATVTAGLPFLEEIQLNEQMACPYCGAWREVCQCPQKTSGTMTASGYFKAMISNRINQLRLVLSQMDPEDDDQLAERLKRWQDALDDLDSERPPVSDADLPEGSG
jgi:hypothetical protein